MSQATAASLALIPTGALAVGVIVNGSAVEFRFQFSSHSAADREHLENIVDEFVDLAWPDVAVPHAYEVVSEPAVSPLDGVLWIY